MTNHARFKVDVAPERCQGHGRCFSIAPELFDVYDYGMSSATGDGAVPPALEEKARLAMQSCPEHAVRMPRID